MVHSLIDDDNLSVLIVWEVGVMVLKCLLYTLIVCQLRCLYLGPNAPVLASVLSHQRLVFFYCTLASCLSQYK